MNLQANTQKTDLTLSAVGEDRPARRRSDTAPTSHYRDVAIPVDRLIAPAVGDGLAPTIVALGATRLCGACATLIRQDSAGAWRHCAVGFDHLPDPDAYERIRGSREVIPPWSCTDCRLVNWPTLAGEARSSCFGCGSPRATESELRALAGDR